MLSRPMTAGPERNKEELQIFEAYVLSVDADAKCCTLQNLRTGVTYSRVTRFPANHSSTEGTDGSMPEENSMCLAAHVSASGGFFDVAIIAYLLTDTLRAQQGIATRAIDIKDLQGWNQRKRGSYRKAWSGQKTVTNTEGYSEKQDDGWDRLAADFSRDRLDPLSGTWTQVSPRQVRYTHAGMDHAGPINRPGAACLITETLPDGTTQDIVYLKPGAQLSDRYLNGSSDVTAFVERSAKVQEFGLDFIVPAESLDTALLDSALGTTTDPWGRTVIQTLGLVSHDDQSPIIDQAWDHPYHLASKAVGPTVDDGPTPRRKGYILEHYEGTLVGSNIFDASTYGSVLKPTVFPYTQLGRFGADVESGYLPVVDSADHTEARLAASVSSTRFTYEYNTTRWDITKEGFMSLEIGSTMPKENIGFSGAYEHPHGAGRSLEAHLVGSLKAVIGKNRDEEDAIDLQALGQAVIRLGSDDSSTPDNRRTVYTQWRSKSDAVQKRTYQYWVAPKLQPGDAGNLQNKTGAESISLRGAFDGGTVLRLGARNPNALRRHLINGYKDAQGTQAWAVTDPARVDSKSPGRPAYAAGDSNYAFHDLTTAGKSKFDTLPYYWSGAPMANMDQHGLSLDVHAVQDALLRVGSNPASGQSILLDTAGGIVAALGMDKVGRSITASLDGGVEMTIGPSQQGKALRIEFNGDVDWFIKGNFHLNVSGDSTFESTTHTQIAKTDMILKALTITESAMTRHTTEAPDIVNNQGFYIDAEGAQ